MPAEQKTGSVRDWCRRRRRFSSWSVNEVTAAIEAGTITVDQMDRWTGITLRVALMNQVSDGSLKVSDVASLVRRVPR